MSDATPSSGGPYVGLRPFEPHEQELLHGRDRDAKFLTAKIFSERLTLLYGQSGLGKSSLLRALVIPALEAADAIVVYFDAWGGTHPYDALMRHLFDEARRLGVPDPELGSPTLVQLVALIARTTQRDVVLIFDQFEEFLVHHGDELDPLRKDIAALARSSECDARLLLALREDFLAALEPFRSELITFFQSTYRLEPLSPDSLRDAIRKPAESFGATCDEEFVDALVADLSARDGAGGSMVELPYLQLICSEIWRRMPRSAPRRLSGDLYRKLGRVNKILASYLRHVMPRWPRRRAFIAKLLRRLAPASGLKISYSADDLATDAGLSKRRTKRELERLHQARLLRKRIYRQQARYELEHDVLIPVLVPWRERVLFWQRWRKRGLVAGSALGVVLLIVVMWMGLEFMTYVMDPLNELCRTPSAERDAGTFESATRYLLGRRTSWYPMTTIEGVLRDQEACLPEAYGLAPRLDQSEVDSGPLVLRHSSEQEIDPGQFAYFWRREAAALMRDTGLPMPNAITLRPDDELPPNQLRLDTPPEATWPVAATLSVTLSRTGFVIGRATDPGARELLANHPEWAALEQPGFTGRAVPRWSLPVWKVTGVRVYSNPEIAAKTLAHAFAQDLTLALSDPMIGLLLDRIGPQGRAAMEDAVANRGRAIFPDVRAWVTGHHALKDLPLLLDALACVPPTASSAQLFHSGALDVSGGCTAPVLSEPDRKQPPGVRDLLFAAFASRPGAGAAGAHRGPREFEAELDAFNRAAVWPSFGASDMSIRGGQELWTEWFADGKLRPSIIEAAQRGRDHVRWRTGVEIPSLLVSHPSYEPKLDKREAHLWLRRADGAQLAERPVVPIGKGADATRDTERELLDAFDASARAWITSQTVAETLDQCRPELRDWITHHFTRSAVRGLLRAVVGKGGNVDDACGLLASVTFWTLVDDDFRNTDTLAGRLYETAEARDRVRDTPRAAAAERTTDALSALDAGQIEAARTIWKAQLSEDRQGTVQSFVKDFARYEWDRRTDEIRSKCRSDRWLTDRGMRVALEKRLEPTVARALPDGDELRVCVAKAVYDVRRLHYREIVEPLLASGDRAAGLAADPAAWLAMSVLSDGVPVDDPNRAELAKAMLRRALPRVSTGFVLRNGPQILTACRTAGSRHCRWSSLLDTTEGALPIDVRLALATITAESEDVIELDGTRELLERVSGSVREGTRERSDAIRILRLAVRITQTQGEVPRAGLREITAELRELTDTSVAQLAYQLLVRVLEEDERWEEAERAARAALTKFPSDQRLTSELLKIGFGTGDSAIVAQIATSTSFEFLAALGQILTGAPDWKLTARRFVHSDSEYSRYVAMMLYGATKSRDEQSEAQQLLDKWWRAVNPDTWKVRLAQGDANVWREMLLGYFAGKVPRDRIFGPLADDATFEQSELHLLPLPRRGLLCEAHFYEAMRVGPHDPHFRESLQSVVATNWRSYYEYAMAKFLLAQKEGAEFGVGADSKPDVPGEPAPDDSI